MFKYNAVIGIGFGDEGKGLVTEFLSQKANNPIIIRYSGGQQAGHCVYNGDNKHIFSNFGSGTFSGAPTYWSEFCTFDPIGVVNELKILNELNIDPLLYVNNNSPVTTPYDKIYNQVIDNKNGTCGVGVGSTFQREEDFYSLTFGDLYYPKIMKEKLKNIRKYYKKKNKFDTFPSIDYFLECVEIIKKLNNIKDYSDINFDGYNTYIFEGSQGLLLDQHYGFFPNVTRSNVGSVNIKKLNPNIIDYYLVTRAYQTRHGNGFMTNNDIDNSYIKNINETNETNVFQGEFRKTMLDVDLLEYALNKDLDIRKSNYKNLVITCLDHIENNYKFTYKNEIIVSENKLEFCKKIGEILKISSILISESPYSENIIKIK